MVRPAQARSMPRYPEYLWSESYHSWHLRISIQQSTPQDINNTTVWSLGDSGHRGQCPHTNNFKLKSSTQHRCKYLRDISPGTIPVKCVLYLWTFSQKSLFWRVRWTVQGVNKPGQCSGHSLVTGQLWSRMRVCGWCNLFLIPCALLTFFVDSCRYYWMSLVCTLHKHKVMMTCKQTMKLPEYQQGTQIVSNHPNHRIGVTTSYHI